VQEKSNKMSLNVNRSIQDAFYRYKMPKLQAKVEGKGNGVKTVIPNMVDIARALGRPPTYCCKYFGCELGAQTQFNVKDERYIVNGAHDAAKLQDMLDGFIKKFVLCEKCENPETVLKVLPKRGIINSSCKACGHNFVVDMRHKLSTFILRNPPEQDLDKAGTSLTKKQDKKSVRKENEANNKDKDECDGFGGGSNGNANGDDDDEEWSTDVTAEAIKERMKDLSSGVKGLAMDDDMEKPESERINIFHAFLSIKSNDGKDGLDVPTIKEVHAEAERLEVTNKAPLVLCEVLLNTEEVAKKIKMHKIMFLKFTNENQKAQKYLLGGIEKLIEMKRDALLPKVAVIFKTLYDEDILDEEVIIEWHKKVSKKYVPKELAEKIHKNAAPFVTWLQEADEESESDSDTEIDFNDRVRGEGLVAAPTPAAAKAKSGSPEKNGKEDSPSKSDDAAAAKEEEDDVDIDDI